MPDIFYPKLSEIAEVDTLPEQLSFIQDGLDLIFEKVFYRDFQSIKSASGDNSFYTITLVSYKELAIDIPGTGFSFVLNPGFSGTSEFPMSLRYEWPILRYIQGFRIEGFAYSGKAFFDLINEILQYSQSKIIFQAAYAFHEVATLPFNDLVDNINNYYSLVGTSAIPYPSGGSPEGDAEEVAISITSNATLSGMNLTSLGVVFEVYVLSGSMDQMMSKINSLYLSAFKSSAIEVVKNILIPKIDASISMTAGIAFPRNILIPLDQPLELGGVPLPDPEKSILIFNPGVLKFSTEGGIGFEGGMTASLNHPTQLASSGFGISFSAAKLDLSRLTNIPEATIDGRPNNFVGVFVELATISFPRFWQQDSGAPSSTAQIVGRNLLIGTGGISGRVSLETTNPGDLFHTRLGSQNGFSIGLDSLSVIFKQNTITQCEIHGHLTLPGFEDQANPGQQARIEVDVSIGNDTFEVTASSNQGITLSIPHILELTVHSLTIGRQPDPNDPGNYRFFICASGKLKIIVDRPGSSGVPLLESSIDIEKIIIYDDGTFEFEGGINLLSTTVTIPIGPATLSVTAITLGKHEQVHNSVLRKYAYFGFDASLNVDPGGVDARGNGLKMYFTVDGINPPHLFFRIQGIKIDLVIPSSGDPAILLGGYLAMKDPSPGTLDPEAAEEYSGGIYFSMPKVGIAGSAAMRLNPKKPAFLIDIGLEIPVPILLGATGLGIYGFRALFGQRYVASKAAANLLPPDEHEWWEYYKAKIADSYHEGIVTDKFAQEPGFSLGAGVSLATATDAGKAFSSKLFFLLSLPGVFLLQGQAALMKQRIGLDTTEDPPFFALLAITDHSIEAAFGANYKIPDDGGDVGKIAKIDGVIESAFFFHDASAWYVNVGRDLPEAKRVQARLLNLFDAYFYLMISSQGIRAGAGASLEMKKNFGPLAAELKVHQDTVGRLSFKPKQIGGSIRMDGQCSLTIFGFGLSVSAAASLAAEAPKPFMVTGSIKACITVVGKEYCAKFDFTWTFDHTLDTSIIPLFSDDSGLAVNIQTKENFKLFSPNPGGLPSTGDLDNFVIPMDSWIDIEFKKGVLPSASVASRFGGNTMASQYITYVSPQKGKSDRVRHEFTLQDVEILYNDPLTLQWQPYDIYGASTPLQLAPFITSNLNTLKSGFWQYQTPDLHNKLRLLAQSPLSFTSQGSGQIIPEELGINVSSIFCETESLDKVCVNFNNYDRPDRGLSGWGQLLPQNEMIFHEKFLMRVINSNGAVSQRPLSPWQKAVRIIEGDSLQIFFNEPMTAVDIYLEPLSQYANVNFYGKEFSGSYDSSSQPVFTDILYQSIRAYSGGLRTVNYQDINHPVSWVQIEAGYCVSSPPGGHGVITDAGLEIGTLISSLASNGHLDTGIDLSENYNLYKDIFFGTRLYPEKTAQFKPKISIGFVSAIEQIVKIWDQNGYLMVLTFKRLSLEDTVLSEVKGFEGIRPDYSNPKEGDNYNLKITAKTYGNKLIDYSLTNNRFVLMEYLVPVSGDSVVTEQGLALINFLNKLVENDDLSKPEAIIYSEGYNAYDGIFQNTPLYKPQKPHNKISYFSIDFGKGFELILKEESTTGMVFSEKLLFDLVIPTEGGDKEKVEELKATATGNNKTSLLASIVKFANLEPDLRKKKDGETGNTFQINALFNNGLSLTYVVSTTTYVAVVNPNFIPGVPTWCGGTLTPEGVQLGIFLEKLRLGNHLTQSEIALSDLHYTPLYNGTFFNTRLLGNPYGNFLVLLTQTYYDTNSGALEFAITGTNGFSCSFRLEKIPQGPLDFTQIKSLYNLRPDFGSIQSGPNYNFLIDALLSNGTHVLLRGRSCYPIIFCGPDCSAYVYEVCFLPVESAAYNATIPSLSSIQVENQAMINAFNGSIQPIWRPNTYYAIRVSATDTLYRDSTTNVLATYPQSFVLGFKTSGPLGHFHIYKDSGGNDIVRPDYAALQINDREEQYKLAGLQHYINFTRCFPNADGYLVNAKPLYYLDPKLLLFYKQAYIYEMMQDWDQYGNCEKVFSQIEAQIKDPAENPNSTSPTPVLSGWASNHFPVVQRDVSILSNMLTYGVPCSSVNSINSLGVASEFQLPSLLPLKLYQAIFNVKYKRNSDPTHMIREVHKYNFQTSRFANFQEHIQSYRLFEDGNVLVRAAIFDIAQSFDAVTQIGPAQLTISGTLPGTDPLVRDFAQPFDRLINGIFKLTALDAALHLEFNILRDLNTSNVLGIIVRSPEPLNDPKTPSAELLNTLTLSLNGGQISDFTTLFSKDLALAFITNQNGSLNIPANGSSLEFTFRLKLWDGQNYSVVATEIVQIILS